MKKNFTTLSSSECLEYYTEVIKNAESKFNSADKIAQFGDYGTALSTQIIGLEELIKALVLFADGKGFEFRKVAGMNSVFKNHGLRYLFSFFLFVFSVFGETLQEGMKYVMKKAESDEGMAQFKAMQSNQEEFFHKYILPHLVERLRFVFSELKWYSEFDKTRQLGFYSDFKDQLHNPADIDEQFYSEFKMRVDSVKNIVFKMIEEFNLDIPFVNKYLPKIIEDCKKKEIYELLALLISKTKSREKSALAIISDRLKDLLSGAEETLFSQPTLSG